MSFIKKIAIFSTILFISLIFFSITSCSKSKDKKSAQYNNYQENIMALEELLNFENLSEDARYGIIKKIATTLLANGQNTQLIIYLTDWVEKHPEDKFNAYWLLMVAHSYMQTNEEPMAEFYFERIIKNYQDLEVEEKSIHFLCLENLIKISHNSDSRIKYFNQLINRFPSSVSITEMYMRLAKEYENVGEWTNALRTYNMFLEQPDAAVIQIPDIPDAYNYAKTLIDFNKSPKDWTFRSLAALEQEIRDAIYRYQPNRLDSIRSKVNFFAVSWRQDENSTSGNVTFSMANYMHGNRITCDKELIPGPTPTEAYLRTTGWTTMPWYFYLREVNFPSDPDIHGRWEWAGIYIGNML